MKTPESLRYTATHEWARLDADGTIAIGITDHAQESLGELVFVEMPEAGRRLAVPVSGPLSGNQAEPLVDACADGFGVGMFLSYQVAPLVAAGRLKHLLVEWCPPPVPVSAVYPHAKLLPARTRLLVDWLRTQMPARIVTPGRKGGRT